MTLRVYDGRAFADPTQTLAQVRKKKGSGKDLSVAKNMKVGNLEDKFEDEFGLKVQVAGSDDSYLCKDELTPNAAQQEDEKKLARKDRKAARQDEASDGGEEDGDGDLRGESSLTKEEITTFKEDEINAEDFFDLRVVADEIAEAGNKYWAKEIYKRLEGKAETFDDFFDLSYGVCALLGDKEWAKEIYKKNRVRG